MAEGLGKRSASILGDARPRGTLGRQSRTPAWIYLVQILLSGVFLTAALFKLQDPSSTLTSIYQYKILSWEASDWLACALPWVETVAALGLWVPQFRLGAILLGSALLWLFVAALLSALARNLDISCGCFGTGNVASQVGVRLVEDLILLAFYLPIWRHHATVSTPRRDG
jgi:putative oxidoreductase